MAEIFLNGNPAVKVNAEPKMWGITDKARLYDIDGDERWVSRKHSKFTPHKKQKFSGHEHGVLVVEEWLFKKMFQKG